MRFLASLVLLISFSAQALPKITVEKINGFEVHFVDIGSGNSVGVSFQVPFGTLHDYGRFLGRAHLLEHLLHTGTLKYPGYHTFDELLLPAGIDSNASTSYGRTFYFAGAKDDQTELLIKVYLSMLGGLELGPEAVENERQVVINEIVEEGLPEQSDAFMQMPYTQLLRAGHPWSQALLGDRPSLSGLTTKDLQELYDQVYRPGIVKIAIHGNFSKPGFLDQVRGWMRDNVKASPQQNGKKAPKLSEREKLRPELTLASREIESLFSETSMAPESQKRLYTHTPDFNMGMILMEADRARFPQNSQAVDFFVRYMNLELPGSFIHKLKTELGWITEGSVMTMSVRGKQLFYFTYTMTEAGKGRSSEINEIFFRGLKDAQYTDVSAEFLERNKSLILHDTEVAGRSVPGFLKLYGEILTEKKSFEKQIEDLKTVSARDIRAVALLLRPDQALYQVTGPALPEMDFDPVFNRKFKLEDNRTALESYMSIMREPVAMHFDPVIRVVNLGELPAPSPSLFARSKNVDGGGERFTVDLRSGLPDTAVSLDFHWGPREAGDSVTLDLVMDAFNERYLAELTYLASTYHVSLASGRTADSFTLTASGEDAYSVRALTWYIEKLTGFVPRPDELDRARERYVTARDSDYVTAFSAQIATGLAKSLVDPLEAGGIVARKLAENVTWDSMRTVWKRLRRGADPYLSAAGALNIEDLGELRAAGLKFARANLSEAERARMKNRYVWESSSIVEVEKPFPKSKGAEAYALVRYYKGPLAKNFAEAAAFQALATLLSNQIYIHNRGQQKLGYIHNAAARVMDGENFYAVLYGGTSGAENAAKTTAGWQYVFDRIKSGEIGDDEINGAISSVANGLARMKTSARELVAQYSGGLNMYGDPRAHHEMAAAARALTPADVRESARKYLLEDSVTHTQLTLHGCEALLAP